MKRKFGWILLIGLVCQVNAVTAQVPENNSIDGEWVLEKVQLKEYAFGTNQLISTKEFQAENARTDLDANLSVMLMSRVRFEAGVATIGGGKMVETYIHNTQSSSLHIGGSEPSPDDGPHYYGVFQVRMVDGLLVLESTSFYNNGVGEHLMATLLLYMANTP